MTIILLSLSLLVFAIYLGGYVLARGTPASISETYYHTECRWLFPCSITLAAMFAWYPLLKVTPENFQFLNFLIVVPIIFVAASPVIKDEFIGKIHAVAAITMCTAAIAWITLMCGIPYIAILSVIIGLFNRKRFVFWLEFGILIDLELV